MGVFGPNKAVIYARRVDLCRTGGEIWHISGRGPSKTGCERIGKQVTEVSASPGGALPRQVEAGA